MPKLDNLPLINNAPGAIEALNQYKPDFDFVEKKRLFIEAMSQANIRHDIFTDRLLPYLALASYEEDSISLEQFTTTMMYWAAYKDFPQALVSCWRYQNPKAFPYLRHHLDFQIIEFAAKNNRVTLEQVPHDMIAKVLKALEAPSVPKSEQQFLIMAVKKDARLTAMYDAMYRANYLLLTPISISPDYYQILVPSQTFIQILHNHLCPYPLTLVPRLGEDNEYDVQAMHERRQHPIGLSFPQAAMHDVADDIPCGKLGFIFHDWYHAFILGFNPHQSVLNELVLITKHLRNRADDDSWPTVKTIQGHFIDCEDKVYVGLEALEEYRISIQRSTGEAEVLLNTLALPLYAPLKQYYRAYQHWQTQQPGTIDSFAAKIKLDNAKEKLSQVKRLIQDIIHHWISQQPTTDFKDHRFLTILQAIQLRLKNPLYKQRFLKITHPRTFAEQEQVLYIISCFNFYLYEYRAVIHPWFVEHRMLLADIHFSIQSDDAERLYSTVSSAGLIEKFQWLVPPEEDWIEKCIQYNAPSCLTVLMKFGLRPSAEHLITTSQSHKLLSFIILLQHYDDFLLPQTLWTLIESWYAAENTDIIYILLEKADNRIVQIAKKSLPINSGLLNIIQTFGTFCSHLSKLVNNPSQNMLKQLTQIRLEYGSLFSWQIRLFPHKDGRMYHFPILHCAGEERAWRYVLKSGHLNPGWHDEADNTLAHLVIMLFPNDSERLKRILMLGCDISQPNQSQHTPLSIALCQFDFEAAKILVGHQPSCMEDLQNHRQKYFNYLCQLIDKHGWNKQVINFLLSMVELGFDLNRMILVNTINPDTKKVYTCRQSTWSYLCSSESRIYQTARPGLPIEIRMAFVQQKLVSPNEPSLNYQYELIRAVKAGRIDYVRALLHANANITQLGGHGSNALYYALRHKYPDIVSMLQSADPNAVRRFSPHKPKAYRSAMSQLFFARPPQDCYQKPFCQSSIF